MSFCVSVVSVFLCLSPGSANADRYVTCIQEQLEDAGLDPGPIDGKLGRKTRSALSKIKVEFPELGSLPKLSIHNASVYCRNIGLMRESRVGWVSDKEIIRIVTGDQIVDSDVVKLKAILEDLNRFYIKEYNVKLPGEIILVVSKSGDEAGRLSVENLKLINAHRDVGEPFASWCKGTSYCGISYGGVVAASFSYTTFGFPDFRMRKLLAHEIAHEIQTQYIGNFRGQNDRTRVRSRGPKWLTEALAVALEQNFYRPKLSIDTKLKNYAKLRKFTSKQLKKSSYVIYGYPSDRAKFYDYAYYAGHLLISKSSLKSIFDFWEETPELGWEKAFSKNFGMSVEEFYILFDDYIKKKA